MSNHNKLPENFLCWLDFYHHSVKKSMDLYSDAKDYKFLIMVGSTNKNPNQLVDTIEYTGTIDHVKARCYDEVMQIILAADKESKNHFGQSDIFGYRINQMLIKRFEL